MIKYKALLLLMLMASFSLSCNRETNLENNVGVNVIPADTLELMIFDVHLADAIITSKIMKIKDNTGIDSLIYQSIYDKYNFSREDFEQTLLFYTHYRLDTLNTIYDRVINRFNIQKGEIHN